MHKFACCPDSFKKLRWSLLRKGGDIHFSVRNSACLSQRIQLTTESDLFTFIFTDV